MASYNFTVKNNGRQVAGSPITGLHDTNTFFLLFFINYYYIIEHANRKNSSTVDRYNSLSFDMR